MELDFIPELLACLARVEAKLDAIGTQAEWLSIKQAARVTGLSSTHIRRAIASRELPASNNGSTLRPLWRIARNDLRAYMESTKGGTKGVPPKPERSDLVKRYFPDL